jgi:lactate dehydrogenase-like 2-hydroxyacid dehydrogenase
LGSELHGKTLLVIGLGATGTEVAKRATAFGMKVIAVTKFLTSSLAEPSSSSVLVQSHSDPHQGITDELFQAAKIESNHKNGGSLNSDLNLTFVNEIHGTDRLLDLIPVADFVSLHAMLPLICIDAYVFNIKDLMR